MEIERIIAFLGMVVSSLLFLALNNASSFWVMIVLVILWMFYLSWAWSEEAFVSGAIALLMSAALIYCHVFSPEIVPDLARLASLGAILLFFLSLVLALGSDMVLARRERLTPTRSADAVNKVNVANTVGGPRPVEGGGDILANTSGDNDLV